MDSESSMYTLYLERLQPSTRLTTEQAVSLALALYSNFIVTTGQAEQIATILNSNKGRASLFSNCTIEDIEQYVKVLKEQNFKQLGVGHFIKKQ